MVGVRAVVGRSVGRRGSARRGGLGLCLRLVGRLGGLRGRMARGVDEAVLAGVPSWGDGRVVGGAGRLRVAVLGGKGAGVFRRGGGLLLGAFDV